MIDHDASQEARSLELLGLAFLHLSSVGLGLVGSLHLSQQALASVHDSGILPSTLPGLRLALAIIKVEDFSDLVGQLPLGQFRWLGLILAQVTVDKTEVVECQSIVLLRKDIVVHIACSEEFSACFSLRRLETLEHRVQHVLDAELLAVVQLLSVPSLQLVARDGLEVGRKVFVGSDVFQELLFLRLSRHDSRIAGFFGSTVGVVAISESFEKNADKPVEEHDEGEV